MILSMAVKNALVIPDLHFDQHDNRSYNLMIKVAKSIKRLHEIVFLGDVIDCYSVSRFAKDPSLGDLAIQYQNEIDCCNKKFDEIDRLWPKAKKVFIEGNHERRLASYLLQDGGPLRNRLTIPKELQLDKRKNWHWIPYTKDQSYQILKSSLYARHEPYGSASARTQAQKSGDSFVFGHTHQVEVGQFVSKLSGREIIAINSGWLGDFKSKVFDYVKDRPNWSHAFTIIHIQDNKWDYQIVKIQRDYTCIYNGKAFKG